MAVFVTNFVIYAEVNKGSTTNIFTFLASSGEYKASSIDFGKKFEVAKKTKITAQ